MATRWGIMSCGRISNDFTNSLRHLPPDEHQVVAAAARNLKSAEKFGEQFSIPNVYGSYKELCENKDVEIVYIGTIHPQHYECCKLALNHGKAVLCEKPMCMNSKQAAEIIQLAKEKRLFFMEGIWSRCFPVYERLRSAIKAGEIGDPRVVHAFFGFDSRNVDFLDKTAAVTGDRLSLKEQGGGTLMDNGVYPVQMAEMVLGKPDSVHAVCTLMPTGVDETTSITCRYPGNKMAVLTCSLSCNLNNRVFVQGSKGIIEIPDRVWNPERIIVNGKEEYFPMPEFETVYPKSSGLVYEAQHVRELLLHGALESPLVSHESSLNMAGMMEEARRQMGIVYDADL